MFSEFVSVEAVRVESSDLVNCSVERDAVLIGGDDIADGREVGVGSVIAVDGERWVIIEDGLAVGLFSVVFVVIVFEIGHSTPLIRR